MFLQVVQPRVAFFKLQATTLQRLSFVPCSTSRVLRELIY